MRDRYLFSADPKATEYKQVLEITPGRARLLMPSEGARRWRWVASLGIFLAYLWITSPVSTILFAVVPFLTSLAFWVVVGTVSAGWFAGLFIVFYLWDRMSLLLLAGEWSRATDLVLLRARSFGTFQDVAARTREGQEMRLIVDARAPRFWEAVQLLEGRPSSSG